MAFNQLHHCNPISAYPAAMPIKIPINTPLYWQSPSLLRWYCPLLLLSHRWHIPCGTLHQKQPDQLSNIISFSIALILSLACVLSTRGFTHLAGVGGHRRAWVGIGGRGRPWGMRRRAAVSVHRALQPQDRQNLQRNQPAPPRTAIQDAPP